MTMAQPKRILPPPGHNDLGIRRFWPDDAVRREGIHMVSERGTGKSQVLGRYLAFSDFIRGVPTIVIDTGDTIDNFLDALVLFIRRYNLPDDVIEQLLSRIRYVNMAGQAGRIVPFPLYYRFGNEDIFEMSQRFVEVVQRLDPALQQAPIQGFNPVWHIGSHAGMILSALNYQITELRDLILHFDAWEDRFAKAQTLDADAAPAVAFFQEDYAEWAKNFQAQERFSLLRYVAQFTLSRPLKAMFGANTPGISWSEVVKKRQIVLLDFRDVRRVELSRFLMFWTFKYLIEFIERRGAVQFDPVSLIIDEFSSMTNIVNATGENLLYGDLDALIQKTMRHNDLWLTLAHQEMNQFPESIGKLLLGMGTQIIGRVGDIESALMLAKQFWPIDPYKVKRWEPVYGSEEYFASIVDSIPTRRYFVLDYKPIEYTLPEQHYMIGNKLQRLPKYSFYVRPAQKNSVEQIGTMPVEQQTFLGSAVLPELQTMLMKRDGRKIDDVLAEIDARTKTPVLPNLPSSSAQPQATLPFKQWEEIE